jgi:hypothetical protein
MDTETCIIDPKPFLFLFEDDKAVRCRGVRSSSETRPEAVKKMPTGSLQNDDLHHHFFE